MPVGMNAPQVPMLGNCYNADAMQKGDAAMLTWCFRKRFPPPPDTWWGILAVGMWQLRGFGGCNDLIFR